jgi:hypothetical protein
VGINQVHQDLKRLNIETISSRKILLLITISMVLILLEVEGTPAQAFCKMYPGTVLCKNLRKQNVYFELLFFLLRRILNGM